ncbi:fructose-specific PTS transporter subunit EIIC [Mycoplasma iguanae]|uniref:Fructose-specific PTS transporter subunit EIIC n=1 Tax=Mycoplasma iguanae TaxID=292461 RepID=A0ABY5R834_9MOLU|nr:fructose-specific PTS transporter subunit EIIC [Mycoplasma iguanae]UVD81436.1 fructose-specific PTS transporter subunit EIIC [Mycoplasma iguanae]
MDIFKSEYVFKPKNLADKKHVLEYIAQKAKELKIASSKTQLLIDLEKREKEFSTGFENGFAIPHAQSDTVKHPTLFFLKLEKGLDWNSLDGQLTQFIFAILIPKNNANNLHLETLSKISVALMDQKFTSEIKETNSKVQLFNLINNKISNVSSKNDNLEKALGNEKLILGLTACPVGIAHTYLSAEKLTSAIKEKGFSAKIQTNGSAGIQNNLTKEEIDKAEVIIVAADIEVPLDKFEGKKVYFTSTKNAIHHSEEIVEKALNEAKVYTVAALKDESVQDPNSSNKKTGIIKHILTGISYMIPYVIFGGIMIALSLGIGKIIYGNNSSAPEGDFLWYLLKTGEIAFGLMIGALGAFIAYGIAGRAGIAPAFIVSTIANTANILYPIGGIVPVTPMGFIGSIVFGILIGYTVKWINTWKVGRSVSAIIPIFVIPLGVTLFYALITIFFIGAPISWVMDKFINGLKSSFENENLLIVSILLGALIGGMAGFDMGGPINKVAFLSASALISQQVYAPMGIMAAAIPVAPLGMGFATLVFRKYFTLTEKSTGISALIMGFIGISEGAIPFAVADPKRAIISNVLGSAVAGAIAAGLSVTNHAAHGGPIVALLGAVGSDKFGIGLGIAFFFLAIIIGTAVTTITYGLLKKYWKDNKKEVKLSKSEGL